MTRLLLVEDNRDDARLFAELLVEVPDGQFVLTTVGTLADALATVGTHDVVFLDLSLPDAHGLAAVPSAAVPAPLAGEPYFDGGYTTARHGSRDGGALDAVQVELPFAGARDTPAARAATAGRLARSLAAFLATHYRPALPASCRL